MNTDYEVYPFEPLNPTPGVPFGALGVDLKQVSIGGTYARKINDKLSLGTTLALVVQEFQAKGLQPFTSLGVDPTKITNSGKSRSTGIGLNFGASYLVSRDMALAFAYAPEVDMDEFDEYAGLFAEDGDFDIPSNYAFGLAWDATNGTVYRIGWNHDAAGCKFCADFRFYPFI